MHPRVVRSGPAAAATIFVMEAAVRPASRLCAVSGPLLAFRTFLGVSASLLYFAHSGEALADVCWINLSPASGDETARAAMMNTFLDQR